MPTKNLGLPLISSNMTADVVRDMNALADTVDAKVGAVLNGKMDKSAVATQVEAETGTSTTKYMTPQRTAQAIAELAPVPTAATVMMGSKSIEAEINDLKSSVSDGKDNIATAITGMGVPASGGDAFGILASKIGQISTGVRWAKGYTGVYVIGGYRFINITGLDFKPRIVLYYDENLNIFGVASDSSVPISSSNGMNMNILISGTMMVVKNVNASWGDNSVSIGQLDPMRVPADTWFIWMAFE